jgi:DNA polymerase-3 subunit gamma/tau
MAKLGGEQTELLQISGDERARVARTALLFTEEELTRNLQIVLRTFDDLNYRQEQRFHLELGLLKLIHAQRLLPLEELLSGTSGGGGRSVSPSAPARAVPTSRVVSAPAAQPSAVSISPFAASASWQSGAPSQFTKTPATKVDTSPGTESISASVATMEPAALNLVPAAIAANVGESAASASTDGSPFAAPAGPASSNGAHSIAEDDFRRTTAEVVAPGPSAQTLAPGIESLRQAVGSALVDAGHVSAAQLLGSGAWNLEGSSLRIEIPGIRQKMLALTINGAAEKIIRQELQRMGAPTRFMVIPGDGPASTSSPIATAPLAGSIQEAALGNPLVQRAKEIFKAEVRSVVDLRQK